MRTRGKIAAFVALAIAAGVACKALDLNLVVRDATPDSDADEGAIVTPTACSATNLCPADGGPDVCDEDSGVCVQCVSDNQCPKNAKHCDPTMHECYACTADSGCSPGMVCVTEIPRCATSCLNNPNACAPLPDQFCGLPQVPYCVECSNPGPMAPQCMGNKAGTFCFGPPTGACGCMSKSDCPGDGSCELGHGPLGLRFCN